LKFALLEGSLPQEIAETIKTNMNESSEILTG
jgi:hypothetical protein